MRSCWPESFQLSLETYSTALNRDCIIKCGLNTANFAKIHHNRMNLHGRYAKVGRNHVWSDHEVQILDSPTIKHLQ